MLWLLAVLCFQSQTFSFENEVALGAQLARDIHARTKPVSDQQIQQYAASIGMRLATHAVSPFPWTFEVVTGLAVRSLDEPLSLPGGYIFIPAKLLLNAQNEKEFAGILAHSMAHQVARDTTRFVIPANVGGLATIPLVFIGGSNEMAIPRAFLPIQKAKEEAAGVLARRIMQDSGFADSDAEGSFQIVQDRLRAIYPAPSLFSHQ